MLGSRDRYFFLIIALLAVMLFDMTAPQGFDSAVGDLLKTQVGLSSIPDLEFVRSLLWFLLLGSTLRYGQMAVAGERLYKTVHKLEELLNAEIPGGFEREGMAYKRFKPPFAKWAGVMYTIVFPLLLAVVAAVSLWLQTLGFPQDWPLRQWFNASCAGAIAVSVILYVHAFHWYKPNSEQGQALAVPGVREGLAPSNQAAGATADTEPASVAGNESAGPSASTG
jgi:hypothetical protein